MKQVYYRFIYLVGILCAFTNVYAQSSALTCNVSERMIPPAHSSMSQTNSGGSSVTYALLGGVLNAGNVIDADTANYATLGQVVASLGTKYLSVKDGAAGSGGYAAGSYAGFEVSFSSLLSVSLLSDISIATYLGGSVQETKSAGALLLSSSLLSSGARGKIGFVTTLPFDEVRYISNGVALLASEVSIYNMVVEKFCAGPALSCNTATTLTKPSYPLIIDNAQTGIGGAACVACSVSNPEYLIDNSSSSYASISLTVGILASGSIAVTDNVSTYAAGTFAGFDIESTSLLTAGVLSNLTIATYNNGVATGDVASGTSLVSAGSSLLSGSGRQVIGFLTTQAFDEVKITAANSVSVSLGLIKVYGMVTERFCSAALPACNTLTALTNPGYPVYVNGQRTGVNTALCAACAISNSQNIIDNNPATYASIDLTAGVAVDAYFSVANALDTYPPGTFAGFDVETNSLLSASVISTATIKLYNNGTLVQTGSGNALIVGASTSLLVGTSRQTAGIVGTVPFDEVQISFNQLVGADLGTIKLYGMQIEKTCAPTLQCNRAYYLNAPDFPAVLNLENTGASGVATVDVTIENPWNVVSAGITDYARINNTATVLASGSISVADPTITYPQGTFAGFVIRTSTAPLVLADLFSAITIRTYNNGVLQETRSGGSLINLTALATIIGTPSSGAAYNVGFYTTLAFDEIRISVASLLGAGLLDDYVDVFGAFVDTRTSVTGSSAVTCFATNPDVSQTYLNVSVSGNLSTNDVIVSGTRYGAAIAVSGNPAATLPVIASDGSFTFIASVAGTYHFLVPVCATDSSINCPQERLTIVVLPSKIGMGNPPVANTDYTATTFNTTVAINILSNDAPGTLTAFLDTASITITDMNGASAGNSARGGTATVNLSTGIVNYTPPTGFSGTDTLLYTICDNQPAPLCGSAYIIVTVWASGASNTTVATDDYAQAISGVPLTGNLKVNDHDPEGDVQTITPQSISTASYTFTLDNAGNYSFTPAASFAGPVQISYTICDNGVPSACSQATMRFLVAMPWKTNADFNGGFVNMTTTGNLATNDQIPSGSAFGAAIADAGNPAGTLPSIGVSGTYTFLSSTAGVYHFYVPVCPPSVSSGCPYERLTITVIDTSAAAGNAPIANTDLATTKFNSAVSIQTLANDGGGMPGVLIDTTSVSVIDMNGAAAGNTARGGTASASSLNGVITYTPALNFVGIDTIRYQVCDNQTVARCATAYQVVTVLSPTAANTTAASDDFKTLLGGSTVSGNVRRNDMDPEGDHQTVTPQTLSTASYSFTLDTAGNFTFAPLGTLFGPQDITYQTCDNGTPQACAGATIHFLVSSSAFALPLELLRFSVREKDCETYAEWEYASAASVGSARLFRSEDGRSWTEAGGRTLVNGRTERIQFPSYAGKSYYRLRVGSEQYAYTAVQTLESSCGNGVVSLFPNPADGQVHLFLSSGCAGWQIADMTGRILKAGRSCTPGADISLADLADGSYTLLLSGSDGRGQSFRLVKLGNR